MTFFDLLKQPLLLFKKYIDYTKTWVELKGHKDFKNLKEFFSRLWVIATQAKNREMEIDGWKKIVKFVVEKMDLNSLRSIFEVPKRKFVMEGKLCFKKEERCLMFSDSLIITKASSKDENSLTLSKIILFKDWIFSEIQSNSFQFLSASSSKDKTLLFSCTEKESSLWKNNFLQFLPNSSSVSPSTSPTQERIASKSSKSQKKPPKKKTNPENGKMDEEDFMKNPDPSESKDFFIFSPDYLEDPERIYYFNEFLQKEHNTENLNFILAVKKFKSLKDAFDLRQFSKRIYSEFIAKDAPSIINISDQATKILEVGYEYPKNSQSTSILFIPFFFSSIYIFSIFASGGGDLCFDEK